MRLFEVTVTKTLLVLAEDERDAERIASIYENDEDGDAHVSQEITSSDQLPREWMNAIPYGGDGHKTCSHLLDYPEDGEIEPPPYVDPPEQLRFDFGGAPA